MNKLLFALALVAGAAIVVAGFLWPRPAFAAPPGVGMMHVFGSNSGGIVVCDEYQQIARIADADDPAAEYRDLYGTINGLGEPACLIGGPFPATVLKIVPVRDLVVEGDYFHAWAVQVVTTRQASFWVALP